jgi:hypothetical protein
MNDDVSSVIANTKYGVCSNKPAVTRYMSIIITPPPLPAQKATMLQHTGDLSLKEEQRLLALKGSL